jgi:Ca-activated chloride channel homolog
MSRVIPVVPLLLLALVPVVLAATRLSTDQVILTGRVLDGDTGAPISSAHVHLEGTPTGTITGATGEYRLVVPRAAIPAGGARLIAQRVGYERSEAVVRPTSEIVRTDFRLRAREIATQEASTGIGADDGAVGRQPIRASMESAAIRTLGGPPSFAPYPMGSQPATYFPHPGYDREAYAHIAENDFLAAATNPLSTFSIDVDRASYGNVRRFLREGRLPPKDAVRIEELVNYFPYDYPRPDGEHPIALATERTTAPWNPEHQLLRISLASSPVETEALPPSNMVFLIDVSGSMAPPTRLPLVKRSMRLLVEQLRPQDRVAIVVYAGAAGLVLPSTPGNEKERILDALERLEAGGSTAGGAGLRLAYQVARENHLRGGNNRVILATDGDFNVGESSDGAMVRLIEEMRGQGTFLTVLGYGMGNLQDSKMQSLAQHGNGNYAYIDSLIEARKVLVTEMGGTLHTVAKDVKLQVEFNPSRVLAYRLIGYENRMLAAEDFNDDAKDAGDMGAGHTVTALYEVVPVGTRTDVEVRGVDPLRYQQPGGDSPGAASNELAFVRVRYKHPDDDRSLLLERSVEDQVARPSEDLSFAAAVAGFGMLLRDSDHRGSITVSQVVTLARDGRGADPHGYRAEFIRLVERYREVAASHR